MRQSKPHPAPVRLFKYLISSFQLIGLVENWYIIPLGVFGLIDFRKGLVLKLRSGIRFKCRHFMDAWTIKEVFVNNDYRIKPSKQPKIIIDIGANIGAFSILAASKMPNAKIFSLEPLKGAFQQLKENISINRFGKQIVPQKMAVYKEEKTIKLYDTGRSGLSSIYRTRNEEKFELIKSTTLEKIFEKNKIKTCDYLKIDCEGAEYDILSNCPRSVFKKIKMISLEFHEMTSEQNHHSLIKILNNNDFRTIHKYNDIEHNIGYIYARK